MLPDQPPTFRDSPASDQPWRWRLLDASGAEVAVSGDLADQAFPSQSDAESWLGEFFLDLADAGSTR